MGKPIRKVIVSTLDGKSAEVRAVIDSGSHPTVIQENCVPKGTIVLPYAKPEVLATTAKGGRLKVIGETVFEIRLEGSRIRDNVLIVPDLSQQMLIGVKTMQAWDITIGNKNGETTVEVGLDLSNPDVNEID